MVFGRPITNEELIERIGSITREDVQEVGRSIREKPDMVSAVVGGRGSSSVVADAAEAFLSGALAA